MGNFGLCPVCDTPLKESKSKTCSIACRVKRTYLAAISVTEKPCAACKRVLPAEKFARVKNGILNCYCRDCQTVLARRKAEKRGKRQSNYKRRPTAMDPIKSRARHLFQTAVRNGTIKRQPCERCGEKKTDGHHEDYLKPLSVVWLCRKHHRMAHRKPVDTPLAKLDAVDGSGT